MRPNRRVRESSGPYLVCLGLLCLGLTSTEGVPAPEKVLPDDTLALVTCPDTAKARALWDELPEGQFWRDPAMKPFKDKFLARWQEEVVQPLERELDVKVESYTSLMRGQLTLAVTRNGWTGGGDPAPAWLLLLDAKDKSEQLKKNLAELRQKCAVAGKSVRTEKVREVELTVLTVTSNDVPKTVSKILPPASEVQELGKEPEKKPASTELVFGQFESLLIAGNSLKAVEKVVIRLTGGNAPTLGEVAAYEADRAARFRDAALYGWVNAKALLEVVGSKAEKKENPDAPNLIDIRPEKLLSATGLAGLKTGGVSLQVSREGSLFELFLGVPEANRQGLLKVLAGEVKETGPPAFVPADAVKFQRWRIDGRKTWAALEKAVAEIYPQVSSVLNFMLDSANAYAKQKDAGFDIRKNLIDNLGDDVIRYEKAARGAATTGEPSGPGLFLIGSPNAEQLASALKSVLVYLSLQAGTPPEEREFLGRKIFSVPLTPMAFPMAAAGKPAGPRMLSYAASAGYVAMSFDASALEEYLRTSEAPSKGLRETAGFAEAAQKVNGPGTTLFGYQNRLEITRAIFESLKKDPDASTNAAAGSATALLPGAASLTALDQTFRGFMDFSLLPAFERVSKYFYCRVYGGSATVDGLTFKLFAPVPPELRGAVGTNRDRHT